MKALPARSDLPEGTLGTIHSNGEEVPDNLCNFATTRLEVGERMALAGKRCCGKEGGIGDGPRIQAVVAATSCEAILSSL